MQVLCRQHTPRSDTGFKAVHNYSYATRLMHRVLVLSTFELDYPHAA